jgi:cytochrome c-type biogenesis protein CcmF
VSLQNGQFNLLWQAIVTISVSRDGEPQGLLTTEKRQYTTQDMGSPPMTEVGIQSYPLEDLYLILSELDDMQGAVSANSAAQGLYLQVLVKPLVSWIWLGCLILAGGTVIALWPSADRHKKASADSAEPVTEPAVVAD